MGDIQQLFLENVTLSTKTGILEGLENTTGPLKNWEPSSQHFYKTLWDFGGAGNCNWWRSKIIQRFATPWWRSICFDEPLHFSWVVINAHDWGQRQAEWGASSSPEVAEAGWVQTVWSKWFHRLQKTPPLYEEPRLWCIISPCLIGKPSYLEEHPA